MHSIVKAIISLLALALVSAAPAFSKNATHSTCPMGYAPLGEICISAASGDIVLPIMAKTPTPSHARAGR